jgi:xylulokinase
VPYDVFCGVDIGTTHIKVVMLGEDGSIVGMSRAPTPVTGDGHGACHDPEVVRVTTEGLIRQAQREAPGEPVIAAMAVTSMGEEGVPLDGRGALLYPSIAWYDRRDSPDGRAWTTRHPQEELFAVSGLHKDLGMTLFKWLWLKSARPQVWEDCVAWLGIADYLVWCWTGQRVMSVSHASRTGIFDISGFQWRPDWAAEVLRRGVETLPALREGGESSGPLRKDSIDGVRTRRGAIIVATGLDHVIGAYAAGILEPGQVLDSMGTAEALLQPVRAEQVAVADVLTGVDFGLGVQPQSHLALAALDTGAGITQMVATLGASTLEQRVRLEAQAEQVGLGAGDLLYIPPRVRAGRGGVFFGHRVDHGAGHLYRAVQEGWCMASAEALDAMGGGQLQRDIVCIGGGSTSMLLTRIKASVLGRQLRVLRTPEVVAVGAALLAARSVGASALASWAPEEKTVDPVEDWVQYYSELRTKFRERALLVHPEAGACPYP